MSRDILLGKRLSGVHVWEDLGVSSQVPVRVDPRSTVYLVQEMDTCKEIWKW